MLDKKLSYINLEIALVFIWIGFVCAISFMEAWLKFQAPGISLPLGLGIGRLVFAALNKVELVISIAILLIEVNQYRLKQPLQWILLVPFFVLALQTTWLLPALDARADAIIKRQEIAPSHLHITYILVEFLKVVSLFTYGIRLFTRKITV